MHEEKKKEKKKEKFISEDQGKTLNQKVMPKSNQSLACRAKRPPAESKTPQASHLSLAAAAGQLQSPSQSDIKFKSENPPGENYCFMDTIIMSLLCATQTGPLLLTSRMQASRGTACFALLHELLYSSWLRLLASDGKKQETVSTNDWSRLRSSFLDAGYTGWGSLDNDSVQAARDATEFAFWLLAEMQNPAIKVRLSRMYPSDEVMGESDEAMREDPVVEWQWLVCNFCETRDASQPQRLEDLLSACLCEISPPDVTLPDGSQDAVLLCRHLSYAPPLLPVKVTRTIEDPFGRQSKLRIPLEVPMEIRVEVQHEGSSGSVSHLYSLRAAICHRGASEKGGHYTAFMQVNAEEAPQLNGWLEFDDQRENAVQKADKEWILSEAVAKDCCVLFYERDAGPAPSKEEQEATAAAAVVALI